MASLPLAAQSVVTRIPRIGTQTFQSVRPAELHSADGRQEKRTRCPLGAEGKSPMAAGRCLTELFYHSGFLRHCRIINTYSPTTALVANAIR
jgi:hypothetical protein